MMWPCGHDEVGRAVLLDDDAALGQVGLHQLGVAGVVHDQALEYPVQRALANVEREPGLRAREAARLDDLREKVGADIEHDRAQIAQAPRHADVVDVGRQITATRRASITTGRATVQFVAPDAVSTMISLSVLRRLSVCITAMRSANGAMIAMKFGRPSVVILKSVNALCPMDVTTFSSRKRKRDPDDPGERQQDQEERAACLPEYISRKDRHLRFRQTHSRLGQTWVASPNDRCLSRFPHAQILHTPRWRNFGFCQWGSRSFAGFAQGAARRLGAVLVMGEPSGSSSDPHLAIAAGPRSACTRPPRASNFSAIPNSFPLPPYTASGVRSASRHKGLRAAANSTAACAP